MSLLDYIFGGSSAPTSGLLASDPTAAASALHAEMRNQQLAGMAAGLLQASGPSFTPHSLGQDIGAGIIGGVQGRQNALRQAVAQQQLQGLTLQNQGTQNLLNYRQQMLQDLNTDPSSPAAARASTMTGDQSSAVPSGLLAPDQNSAQPAIFQTPGGNVSMPGQGSPAGSILPGQSNIGDSTIRLPAVSAAGEAAPAPGGPPGAAPVPYAPKLAQTQNGPAPLIDPTMALRNARLALANGDDKSAAVWLSQVKPPDGYQYLSNGSQRAIPGGPADPTTHLALGTADALGKGLLTRDANGNVVALPLSQETAARGAGLTAGAQANATLPADLTKIGATGNQTRKTAEFDASITPDTMTVPAVDSTGKPVVDSNGQPIMQTVQTSKLAKVQAGPVVAGQVLSPQQKAQLAVEQANLTNKTARSQEAGVIPGTGGITAGLPAQAQPVVPAGGRPNSVLWKPGAAPPAAPSATPIAPQAIGGQVPAGFTTGFGLPHALVAAETKSATGRAEAMTAWGHTAVANQSLQQQLGALTEVAQRYNTGKLSPGATDVGGWVAALGLDPTSTVGDPANGEEFNKAASNLITRTIQASSSNPAHALWGTIEAGSPTAEKRPETNHDLVAQLSARATWESDLYKAAAQQFPNGVPSTDFITKFTETHPQKDYLDKARAEIPPFAGMSGSMDKPLKTMGDKPPAKPLPNRWYTGKAVPGGKAMVNPAGTGWWVPTGPAQ